MVLDHGIFLTVAENLIGNAARFAKSGLSIEAVLENGQLLLKISDDGPGYPPELIENGPKPLKPQAAIPHILEWAFTTASFYVKTWG